MPLIGDAAKIMAGATAATAVYAGAVKVWPTAVVADYTALWVDTETPYYALNLQVQAERLVSPPPNGSFTVDVPVRPGTVRFPTNRLGAIDSFSASRLGWNAGGAVTSMSFRTPVTNQQAVQWGGHVVRFTTQSGQITGVTVL
jgi:hypothetical protein